MLAALVVAVLLLAAAVVGSQVAAQRRSAPDTGRPAVAPGGTDVDDTAVGGLEAARAAVEADRVVVAHDRAAVEAARTAIARERADVEAERAATATDRAALDKERTAVEADRIAADADREALAAATAELATDRAALTGERERLAGLTADEARQELVASLTAEATLDAQRQARRIEADAVAAAETRARSIVAHAVQRLATETTSEATVVSVRLPDEVFKGRVIGREGRNIKAFEAVTGVDVLVDQPETVQLSCFDGRRREIARLTMAALVEDGRIHPQRIEEAYAQNVANVDAVARRAAEDALLKVGIADLHPALVEHLGALRFRTSYGQNVLAHLVESAAVASTLAAELSLPPKQVALVRRCAFLHDIGKALTHDHEGSHALLGAELARRYGEDEAVAHAIEAHHDEVPPATIEAVLTQASDACSGGRPGARRESAQAYGDRLARIEEIARQQPGVDRVYAMQAGQEVRVMVEPDEVDDHAAAQIARTVAKQIEQELTYPGQIRVTVVRESRVSEVAH